MKAVLALVAGVGLGFVAAHYVSKTPQGKAFLADVDEKAHQFGEAVVDGYRQREAELRAAVAEVGDVIGDLGKRAD